MNEDTLSDLLARYLAGEASAPERAEVDAWAAAAPENRAELDRLRAVWKTPPASQWDIDRGWARVQARISPAERPKLVRPLPSLLLPLAAAVVILLGVTLVWRAIAPQGSRADMVVATVAGERRSLDLPDGSRVVLAPASELRVDIGYGRTERRVDLSGEAWFEVAHDQSRPFRVYASGTITEDLGTEFAVAARPGAPAVRVVVVSGAASLRPAGAPPQAGVTLEARDIGVLASGAERAAVHRAPVGDELITWTRGLISFEDAPLDSVLTELERWYGTPFRLDDPGLASRRLTAPFQLDQLYDALETLRLSLGVTIDRSGDTVIVR